MQKTVIVINGAGGSGKDTFVGFCQELMGVENMQNVSSVDEVKQEAQEKHGWDPGDYSDEARNLLVQIKQEHIQDNDRPTRYAISKITKSNGKITFVHIREPEEIEKLRKECKNMEFKFLTLHMIPFADHRVPDTIVDKGTENYDYDVTIANDGDLDDLKKKAEEFIARF